MPELCELKELDISRGVFVTGQWILFFYYPGVVYLHGNVAPLMLYLYIRLEVFSVEVVRNIEELALVRLQTWASFSSPPLFLSP